MWGMCQSPKHGLGNSVQISDRLRVIKASVYYMIMLEKCVCVWANIVLHMLKSMWIFYDIVLGYMDIGKVWCHLTWSVAGLRESIQRSKQANRRSLVNHKLVARAAMDNLYGAFCGHIPWTKSDLTKMGRHNLVGTSAFRSHSSLLHLYLHILYKWTTAPRCIHTQVQRDSAQQSFIPLAMQHCQVI